MPDHSRSAMQAASFSGNPIEPEMNPAEEVVPGLPGTGENVCPKCSGGGLRDDGNPCEHCGGTGKVIEGIVGA